MTQVTLHHLHKNYDGGNHAVADLSLTISAGKITALLGPSGCGKTTILKMIAGLLEPTSGDIQFNGRSILPIPAEKRGAVMVFQNHLLFPHMSVADNIAFGLKMRGEKKETIARKVAELLDLVRLPGYGERRPKQLSGGQQQRVALARALIVEPQVLLLDEPLSNLDAHLRNEMRDLIFNLQRQLGITTIVVTHDQEEAVILADQIALLFNGILQQFGEPSDFYERPLTVPVARFFGQANFIPGHQWGAQVETSIGAFVTAQSNLPDGSVILAIRPEHIQLGDSANENQCCGHVVNCVYAGTHTRFTVQTNDTTLPPLHIIAHDTRHHPYAIGDPVTLTLPANKIWLLPPE